MAVVFYLGFFSSWINHGIVMPSQPYLHSTVSSGKKKSSYIHHDSSIVRKKLRWFCLYSFGPVVSNLIHTVMGPLQNSNTQIAGEEENADWNIPSVAGFYPQSLARYSITALFGNLSVQLKSKLVQKIPCWIASITLVYSVNQSSSYDCNFLILILHSVF